MKLQTKIWFGTSAVIGAIMALDLLYGYHTVDAEVRARMDSDARIVRALLMATRRIYHQQFLASGLPVDEHTVGFLPAHALSRISAEFPRWIDSGLRFNNVTDRPRNPANQADASELAAMNWFRSHPTASERIAEIRDTRGQRYYHFTAPLWIEPYCMKCHGDRSAAPMSIRDRYAGAYGYKIGDLRGVMSIKLPMEEVYTRKLQAWWKMFAIRAAGYATLLLLVGVLLQQLVIRRLAKLNTAAQRLGTGDLSTRAEVSGNDEVAAVAENFNAMAGAIAQRDAQVARLNHMYAALSETNKTIVRIDNEAELLARVCRIAVENGDLRMAWIARLDDNGLRLTAASAFGQGIEYIEGISIATELDASAKHGPTATALLTNQPVIIQDFFADASTRPWHERARPFGWGASAAYPILRGGKPAMVLNLYHAEKNAFDARMQRLLSEMVMDIGYALDRIDLVAAQQQIHAALRESEQKYRTVVATSQDGFLLVDRSGRILEVNDAYVAFSGYTRKELLGMHFADLEDGDAAGDALHISLITQVGSDFFESHHRTRAGTSKPVEVSTTYSPTQGGLLSVFVRDLSKRREAEEQIQRLSNFDTLTGLPNRAFFTLKASQAITIAQQRDEHLSLMFLDIDHFSQINDTLGHRIGDKLLIELAERFRAMPGAHHTIARLGGDEFLLLLPHADTNEAVQMAERLLLTVSRPFTIEGKELTVTPSIGIAMYPDDGDNFETLMRRADTAISRAKHEGRNTYRFFALDMQARTERSLQLEAALRRALERDELQLHYQPQLSLQDGSIAGVEALLRWQHPELGLLSPSEFIPIAENCGLILPIGQWVLGTALRQMRAWRDAGLPLPLPLPLPLVAVNLSPIQLRQQDLPRVVAALLSETGVPASCLELELTESATMQDPEAAIAMMDALHALGTRISIDDFGTGYSSLGHLKRFHVDKLKIDQSFVRDLAHDPEDRAIINLANTLQFRTIAEGVETAEQLDFLQQNGCHEIQGYLYSRPLAAEALTDWLRAWRPDRISARSA